MKPGATLRRRATSTPAAATPARGFREKRPFRTLCRAHFPDDNNGSRNFFLSKDYYCLLTPLTGTFLESVGHRNSSVFSFGFGRLQITHHLRGSNVPPFKLVRIRSRGGSCIVLCGNSKGVYPCRVATNGSAAISHQHGEDSRDCFVARLFPMTRFLLSLHEYGDHQVPSSILSPLRGEG